MEKTILMKLELCAPLFYSEIISSPEGFTESRRLLGIAEKIRENEEILLCFKLNPQECYYIEPDRSKFLGKTLFIGKKIHLPEPLSSAGNEAILPAGSYLFVQSRGDRPLDREEWLDMAIEQQKDGLWERNKPGDLLYIRYLYEDGAIVTQVFRPCVLCEQAKV